MRHVCKAGGERAFSVGFRRVHRRFPVACTCLRSRSFRLPIPLRLVNLVRIAGQPAHLVLRRASSEAFEGGHFPNFCTVSGYCFEGVTPAPVVCNVFAGCPPRIHARCSFRLQGVELSKKVQLENTLMQKPIAMLLGRASFPGIWLGAIPLD